MRELRLACFGFVFKGNYSFWSFWSLRGCNGWLEEVCISSHVLQPNRSSPCLTCDQLVPVRCRTEVEKVVARHLVCNSVHVSHEGACSLGSCVPGGKGAGSGAGNSRVTLLSRGGFIPWRYTHLLFFLVLKLLIVLIGIIPFVALCISDQLQLLGKCTGVSTSDIYVDLISNFKPVNLDIWINIHRVKLVSLDP